MFENYDEYILNAMASWPCPGAAICVVKGDDILYQKAFGLRDIDNQLPVTVDTRFAMASCTKSFAAMSIALLVDAGKLEWDRPVCEVMPEFILDDPYATRHITVRDMLCHRSGMPRHDLSAWRLDLSRAEFIRRMCYLKFNKSFREVFQYNNLMYYAVAYLVEKVSGQAWEDFVQERIFNPLMMTASNFNPEPPQTGQVNALGYRVDRDAEGKARGYVAVPFGKHTQLSPGSAGALFSTLADLTNWLKVHVNAGRFDDFQLVSPGTLAQMHLPQMVIPAGGSQSAILKNTIFNYGMGWFIEPYKGYTLVHHGGNVEGHSLIIGFVPQAQIGVVALTNIAQLPLRDILLYESIDRALDLPEQDWNAQFHKIYDPIFTGIEKSKGTSAEERLADAPTTHPLEMYAGRYEAKGYPDFAVRLVDGKLQACLVGSLDWFEFRHYHYDVFEWYLKDIDEWLKVRFQINDNGEVDAVSIPIEPAVDNVLFTRKPPELPQDWAAGLLGVYDPGIEGLLFTVSAREGKLYLTQTGLPAEEMGLYRVEDACVEFRIKRNRFDFMREQGAFARLVIKVPGLTLTAVKKG
jgi:CubicO group peptidase (beta-lactamase class C family)